MNIPVERPLAAWTGSDRIRDQVMSALTIILKTGGCAWNRCRMCSYRHERYGELGQGGLEERLLSQVSWIRNNFCLDEIEAVKI
ncbi:MAG TPA: TIGR01210 family radical SAM protein, partial [Methanolinea sp.]|nr:TIGR01210 family radical SAM protein [Methanolinea sp.]